VQVYEIMWENAVERGQATDDNMAHAHCMLDNPGYKHTHTNIHTHTKYVILIALPLQQRLHERTVMIRCTCITCLVKLVP